MSNKKPIFKALLIIFILFIFLVSISLLFKDNNKKENTNVIDKKLLKVNLSDKNIFTLKSILPITDELGKNVDVYSVSENVVVSTDIIITNNTLETQKFDIFVYKYENASNEINPNYIKFYLTDIIDNPLDLYSGGKLPSFVDLEYFSDMPSKKKLYSGEINPDTTLKYKLKAWISDSYVISTRNEEFKFIVGVRNK